MLELRGLAGQYGEFSLSPFDLQIGAGESHVLLGPSGAGKSTVLELIVGFREPSGGSINMHNREITRLAVERRGVGYVPQQPSLFPHLSVRENILFGIRCRRRPTAGDMAAMEELATSLGIIHLLTRRPTTLSGGERQRVALARALAPHPDLLVLDEPFAAVNETLRRELWHVLLEVHRQRKVAMLMVTHDLEEAFHFGEQVHVLIDGALQQSAARREVFDRPENLAVARFLGIANLLPATITAREGAGATLRCAALGTTVALPQCDATYVPGDDVVVGVRPEHIALHPANPAHVAPGHLMFAGTIESFCEEIHGAVVEFRASGGEGTLAVRGSTAPAPGGNAIVTIDPARLFLLPAGSPLPAKSRDNAACP